MYKNRGNAYFEKGEYDWALRDFNQAIRLDSNDSKAYKARGLVHERLGDNERALADYGQAFRLDPKAAADTVYRTDTVGTVENIG